MDIGTQFTSKGGNILILTYWSFSDALIQTYTLPYVRMIRKVISPDRNIYLFTLEKNPETRKTARSLEQDNILWLPVTYHPMGWKAFVFWAIESIKLKRLIKKEHISHIHCWGTPAGAIGYVLSRLTGANLILDSYEPHAEAMVENGTWRKNGVAFRLLFWLEKKQTERARVFISATEGMRSYAKQKYGLVLKKFYTKPAGVDLNLFSMNQVKRRDIMFSLGLSSEHLVCVYAGKFGGIYLEQEVFDFFAAAAIYWKDRFKVLLLTNTLDEEIEQYCADSGLDPAKVIIRFVPHEEVPAYLGVADFAITPVKPVASKRFCSPIKNGEYWALGLPVVIPANISDDSSIIENNDVGAVLYELNERAYIKAVIKIDRLLQKPDLRNDIRKLAYEYRSFSHANDIYKEIYS